MTQFNHQQKGDKNWEHFVFIFFFFNNDRKGVFIVKGKENFSVKNQKKEFKISLYSTTTACLLCSQQFWKISGIQQQMLIYQQHMLDYISELHTGRASNSHTGTGEKRGSSSFVILGKINKE